MKTLYFDTETTGLDPVKNDIIQIAGIVEIDGEVKEEFKFECQPFSYENISAEALKVHGYGVDDLKMFQKPEDMYRNLRKIFGKYIDKFNRNDKFIPAGQNVRFDMDFLNQFFIKNSDKYYGSWMQWFPLDLLSLVTLLKNSGNFHFPNFKLETIAAVFAVKFEAHDALEDIRATREIIKLILDRHIKVV